MGSTNKTDELELNQWIGSDVPKMEDFNKDNEIIDKILGEHIWDISKHVTAQQKKAWSNPIGFASYLGNGTDTRRIKLNMGFEPTVCLVFSIDNTVGLSDFGNNVNYNYFGIATINGSTYGLKLDGDALEVKNGVITANFEMTNFNQVNKSYLVVGFR
ncbi:hypothetical protein [Eubacterium sp.]